MALFLLPGVGALALKFAHHPLDVPTNTLLVTAAVGLPVAWLTWAGYRDARRSAAAALVTEERKAQVADQLADSVGRAWENEAVMRRLDEPYPLPVSWVPADPSLTEPWDLLVGHATRGHGWPPPPPPGNWAVGPEGLAGDGRDLSEVLKRVPTGRLVVLGERGAGKTMLMVGLVLDLMKTRTSGSPVPVLVPLAGWNPEHQDLHGWLSGQLTTDYPLPVPPSVGQRPLMRALLDDGLILPILDGLDEIPAATREKAIEKISDALRPGRQLVMTCRTEEYEKAVSFQHRVGMTLHAAVVKLDSLDTGTIVRYLCAAGTSKAAERWSPVLAALGANTDVRKALQKPLMVALAGTIYNPRGSEQIGELRNPEELCKLPDQAAIEASLFDAFIPAAYRTGTKKWRKPRRAKNWLEFLARHLEYEIRNPDFARRELHRAVPGPDSYFRLATRRELFGIGQFSNWLTVGFVGGIVASLAGGIAGGIVGGIVAGVVGGIMAGLRYESNYDDDIAYGIYNLRVNLGLWTGVVVGFPVGYILFTSSFFHRSIASGPPWSSIITWLAIGCGYCVLTVPMLSMRTVVWPWYVLARVWLAFRNRLPWRLTSFLADAHQRGVLRRVGAVYQFRHIELQHRLATQTAKRHGQHFLYSSRDRLDLRIFRRVTEFLDKVLESKGNR